MKVSRKHDSTRTDRPRTARPDSMHPRRKFADVLGDRRAPSRGAAEHSIFDGEERPEPELPRDGRRRTHRTAGTWSMTQFRVERRKDETRDDPVPVEQPVDIQSASRQVAAAVERAAPPARAELDPVFDRVVQEIVVMEDRHRRRRVEMRLSVRGRSDLNVEVRRGDHGVEVRFSTHDDELKGELRRRRGELAERARNQGAPLAAVHVA